MLKTLSDTFAGFKMTVISGIFLFISLIFMLTKFDFLVDPAWMSIILSGYPLLYLALTRLIYQKWVSSALLISIAMVASIAIGEHFAAGEVAFIMAIGAILEERTVEKARKGLTKLVSLIPKEGRRISTLTGIITEEMIPVDKIRIGDIIRVLPGEAIPVDGKIIFGTTTVDQSIMTGESLPVDKVIDDEVFCGTLNCFGSIDISVTKVGEDSSLQKLIQLVKEAEDKKAPMQRIVDKWAVWLVPIALLVAIGAYIVNLSVGVAQMQALNRAVTVLVVFCPCALALATPTSIIAAIGQATKHGVIIKSGEALENMGKVDTITFDKTGTLTEGKLSVSNLYTANKHITERELLSLLGTVESRSEHPIGKAIVNFAKDSNIPILDVERFEVIAGRGVEAVLQGSNILCGNESYLIEKGVALSDEIRNTLDRYREQGKATVLCAKDMECLGLVALSDSIRSDSKEMIKDLDSMGVNTVLLTGDNRKAANFIATQVSIKSVESELLPSEKLDHIERMQKKGHIVAMVGDGVNDAPALKIANVGVAMGSMGSDIAVEAADIALMSDDIGKIPYLQRLSRSTLSTIKLNITLSMIINFIAVVMSVLGMLNPITGALVHNAGSVLVVLNAARLYDRKFS